jgi:acyl carrier protein
MQEMEIKEKVIRVICQHLGIKELTEEFCTKPLTDIHLDSLDRMELILKLENELLIHIPDQAAVTNQLVTTNDFIEYILKLYSNF